MSVLVRYRLFVHSLTAENQVRKRRKEPSIQKKTRGRSERTERMYGVALSHAIRLLIVPRLLKKKQWDGVFTTSVLVRGNIVIGT